MIGPAKIKSTFQEIFRLARGRPAEAIIEASTGGLTRFADNRIHQNVCQSSVTLSIRTLQGRRQARTTSNRRDEASLKENVERCLELTSLQEEDRDLLPLPGPQSYRRVAAYSAETARGGPEEREGTVSRAVRLARKLGVGASGICATETTLRAIANSRGLFAYHARTLAELSVTATADDGAGWAQFAHYDVSRLDAEALARRAADRAIASRSPMNMPPAKYAVVFEHPAAADFLMFLAQAWSGLAYLEHRSCFDGRLGQKVMGENVSIEDNAYHDLVRGIPFDGEGIPRKPVSLVENGILRGLVYDRRTARKAGKRTTGHGLEEPNVWGPHPANLVMRPGNSSLPEMISGTKRGLLVTHLHYTNVLDPMLMILTGMTRDGTFLIEKGRVTRPLRNLRFTESVLTAFSNVEAISRDQLLAHSFFGGFSAVPALKIRDFSFSSATEF